MSWHRNVEFTAVAYLVTLVLAFL